MNDDAFLTAEEVSARYRGEITVGTLRNWRSQGCGPPFLKMPKAILYPLEQLVAWEQARLKTKASAKNKREENDDDDDA